MKHEYCVVIVRLLAGGKRTEYLRGENVPLYVHGRLEAGGVQRILIRPCTQAEYVRHTTSE